MNGVFFLPFLLLILACNTPETPERTPQEKGDYTSLIGTADSLILELERCMESADGEFDQLKFRNMRDILRENREMLARTTPAGAADSRVMVGTQADYLQSLLIATEALLSDHPLSVGKWEGEVRSLPDSVRTPVGRTR